MEKEPRSLNGEESCEVSCWCWWSWWRESLEASSKGYEDGGRAGEGIEMTMRDTCWWWRRSRREKERKEEEGKVFGKRKSRPEHACVAEGWKGKVCRTEKGSCGRNKVQTKHLHSLCSKSCGPVCPSLHQWDCFLAWTMGWKAGPWEQTLQCKHCSLASCNGQTQLVLVNVASGKTRFVAVSIPLSRYFGHQRWW